MKLPELIEPPLEPRAMDGPAEPPPWWPAASRLSRVAGVVLVALLFWHDTARYGPWPGLASPFDLFGWPLSDGTIPVAVIGCAVLAYATWSGRRASASVAAVDREPGVTRLPVFLRFDGRTVVVVGGGTRAAAKIPALLAAGARVTVIAPRIDAAIAAGPVTVVEREFRPSDLDGAWFVTAAAPPAVNRDVREAADARALFVNAVDDPGNASAYLGGTVARGGVTVAFSTDGRAPALAGLLREALDDYLPQDVGAWLTAAHALSQQQRRAHVPIADRRPQLLNTLNRLYAGSDEHAGCV